MTDKCRIENIDGVPVRVRGSAPMDDEDRKALGELIDAVKRRFENEQRCEKTDLYVSQCAHCRKQDLPNAVATSTPFTANYSAACVGLCERSIQPGDTIVRCDGGGYAHKECAQ